MKDSHIVVIAGGISDEREISLRSGKGCFEALKKKNYSNVSFLDIKNLKDLLDLHAEKPIDVAFLCTHGNFGEDGKLQAVLEWLKISYTGSGVLASALCMNKHYTREILKANGVKVSDGGLVSEFEPKNFPVMLKLAESGSSFGISKINTKDEFLSALNSLSPEEISSDSSSKKWIIEEFVKGKEITVSLLEINGKLTLLPILELRPKKEFYDLEAKYTKGMTDFILPAELNEEITKKVEKIAEKVFKLLDCKGFARVDMIVPEFSGAQDIESSPVVLEVNSLPGMTETSDLPAQAACVGINYDSLVEFMLLSAIKTNKSN